MALAQRVQELLRYRSEFFGKLHEILGNHPDIRVVGDRFVFQSKLSAKVCRRDGLGIKILGRRETDGLTCFIPKLREEIRALSKIR